MPNNFSKDEKLKSRKMIGNIFSDGRVVKAFPIRIQFVFHNNTDVPVCQMGVSVPKRNFKKAVDRNRIKRQLREAFRLHKHDFYLQLEHADKRIALMVIYTSPEKLEYSRIESALIKAVSQIRI